MFNTTFENIFSSQSLEEALSLIKSKSSGLDKEFLSAFKNASSKHILLLHKELMNGQYIPQPIKKIEIQKENKEYRPIAIASLRDKVVQKALQQAIEGYFDKIMSNKSYGYRKDKSSLKAIGRCRDFINRGHFWVYKSDIDNFFETISHDKLLHILDTHIEDKKIIRLISLYLQNGGFKRYNYMEHRKGVHQGDVLSPLLSNIYLNEMDMFLEREKVYFVRYADDFVLFFEKKKEIERIQKKLKIFLKPLSLKMGDDKSYTANIFEDGFTFLGVHFKDKNITIDNERLQKKISKLFQIAREDNKPFKFVEKINLFLEGLSFYYLKIISQDSKQFTLLFNALIDASAQYVFLQRKKAKLKNKKDFKEPFALLNLIKKVSLTQHRETIERIVSKGFEKYLATKSYKKDSTKIKQNKQKYAKSFAYSSVLYVNQVGAYMGVSKNLITVKLKGKIVAKIPKKSCEHIIIAGKGISISSNMVYMCVEEEIGIDFVDGKETPFASLHSFKNAYPKMALLQLEVLHNNQNLRLAKEFIKGKSKNQLNYLKYLNRYHKELDTYIELIEKKSRVNIKKAKTVSQLMGYEGEISTLYWKSISIILVDKINFTHRVKQGAGDIVNASLNYGYAILYAKVQKSLLKAGLALHISFLHSLQGAKPTLVYDMIEEFRSFVVDRAIISMINKNEKLALDKDKQLTKESRILIVKNVKERLGVYTQHKKESKKVENIIQNQAYLLAKDLKNEMVYKPFIGKY